VSEVDIFGARAVSSPNCSEPVYSDFDVSLLAFVGLSYQVVFQPSKQCKSHLLGPAYYCTSTPQDHLLVEDPDLAR